MNFELSSKTRDLISRLDTFMATEIYPVEAQYHGFVTDSANLWKVWPGMEALKDKAKAAGLWNLFLPHEYHEFSPGLTNLEYAPLAERMGRIDWASVAFNCSAPDTGNMEVLAKYGSPEQKEQWLKPLLAGEIRSAYAMTEPQVASSDATNIELSIQQDSSDFVLNGRKWWISGVMHPDHRFLIVLGRSNNIAGRHAQHSMIIVPAGTPGLTVVRHQSVFGRTNTPFGEAELRFDNVRVPASNLLLGEGRGFEIAQGRLGPGRIHHCMRSIGQAQRALEIMARRADTRVAFGRKLADQSSVRQDIARSYIEVEMARLLTLKAADAMDRVGNKVARDLIAAIKIVAPKMEQTVADRGVQILGGMGVSDDTPIANFFTMNRFLRLADGPDEVHLSQLGKLKVSEYCALDPLS